MDKKENEQLAIVYKQIASELIEKKSINRYEYYLLGGISLSASLSVIYSLFRERKITTREFDVLGNYIKTQLQNLRSSHSKDFALKTFYQFGDVVISDEEKEMIWNNLCRFINEKDIDDVVFSGAVRDYALENGLIKINNNHNNQKKLVKRK